MFSKSSLRQEILYWLSLNSAYSFLTSQEELLHCCLPSVEKAELISEVFSLCQSGLITDTKQGLTLDPQERDKQFLDLISTIIDEVIALSPNWIHRIRLYRDSDSIPEHEALTIPIDLNPFKLAIERRFDTPKQFAYQLNRLLAKGRDIFG